MNRAQRIRERLLQSLPDAEIEIIDESHLHAGHAGSREHGGGHFRLRIVSPTFRGKNRVQRHQQIHAILQEMFKTEIHALSIEARAPADHD